MTSPGKMIMANQIFIITSHICLYCSAKNGKLQKPRRRRGFCLAGTFVPALEPKLHPYTYMTIVPACWNAPWARYSQVSVWVYCAGAFIAALVIGPTRPSGTKPLAVCHWMTAAEVIGPNWPSTDRLRPRAELRSACKTLTLSPELPTLRVAVPKSDALALGIEGTAGATGADGAAGATAFIAALVIGPTRPSGTKPLAVCDWMTAATVIGPIAPATARLRPSEAFKKLCSSITPSPVLPFLSVVPPKS